MGPNEKVTTDNLIGRRQECELLRSQLDLERSSFISHWKQLGDYTLPRRLRLNITDANRGERRNRNIIDSTATLAARTLRSGMMGGVTSPARTWFRLTTPDPGMSDLGPVKQWLYTVSQRMETVFAKSNLYNVLPTVYGDLGVFSTAPMIVEEDFDRVIRCSSFPVGSYMIAKDYRGIVNVFFREYRLTVRQVVDEFGRDKLTGKIDWSNISPLVRDQYDIKHFEQWIDICHVIKPNPDFNPKLLDSKYKKFSSLTYERGTKQSGAGYATPDNEVFLRDAGYDYFPVLCPRWEVTAEDVYGTSCPGMDSLGDIMALQTMQKRKAQAIEKMVNPPMIGSTALKNAKASILPGDITYDDKDASHGFRPAHEVKINLQDLMQDIETHQERIKKCYYEDLFLMMAESDRRQITATEIDERKEEKLLALGPVLEQLNQDLLDPLIDITYRMMDRQGMIPPPPQELQGAPLKVEYMSIMAQAQKLLGIQSTEKFCQFVAQVVQVDPTAIDKVDTDQLIDVYADMTSVAPGIIRPEDAVQQMRQQRQKQQQQQQQMAAIQQGAGAAKDLSQTDMSGNNALTQLMQQGRAGQLAPAQ